MGILKTIRKIKDPGSDGEKRSNKWPAVRKAWLDKNPTCAVCGGKIKCQVHHKFPFHLDKSKELDPTNFITLCEGNKLINCHCKIGHLGNFKSYNDKVEETAKYLAERFSHKEENEGK